MAVYMSLRVFNLTDLEYHQSHFEFHLRANLFELDQVFVRADNGLRMSIFFHLNRIYIVIVIVIAMQRTP